MKEQKIAKKTKKQELAPIAGDIISGKSPGLIGHFIKKPVNTIAEIGIGILGSSRKDLALGAGRVLKAMKAGNGQKQFSNELSKLREEGKIQTDEELMNNKHAIKCFIDFLEVIDNNPDEDRLNAIKSMFFLLIKADQKDKEDLLAYELFNITMKLNSSELVTLKLMFDEIEPIRLEVRDTKSVNPNLTPHEWFKRIAARAGHNFPDLIERDANKLKELHLIDTSVMSGRSYIPTHFKPSALGIKLCETIQDYEPYTT